MWDDVIIGTGHKGSSAYVVFAIKGDHHVSQNNVSYWISDVYLGLGMTIFKYTKEGEALTKMIQEEKPLEEINKFLEDLLIRKISVDKLKSAIDRATKDSFNRGLEAKAKEIRDALGIY